MKLKHRHARRAIAHAERSIRHLEKLSESPRFPGVAPEDQAFVHYRLHALTSGLHDITLRLKEIFQLGKKP